MKDVNIIKQYLATGLKCKIKGETSNTILELTGIHVGVDGFVMTDLDAEDVFGTIKAPLKDVLPILHPLSDFNLGKTGREVMDTLNCTLNQVHELWDFTSGRKYFDEITAGLVDVMSKNHIDYNGLIDREEAVDINSIKNNQK